jgi:hypothetical protein
MSHTGGRMAWPLWLVSEGGRDVAVVAAPSADRAVAACGSRSVEAEAVRVGVADDGPIRVVRRLCSVPTDRPDDPPGRRMLERAAAAAGIPMSAALSSYVPEAVAARWAVFYVLVERGVSLKGAGRQLGGRDHSTVSNAVAGVPVKLAAGDETLRACIEAARSVPHEDRPRRASRHASTTHAQRDAAVPLAV